MKSLLLLALLACSSKQADPPPKKASRVFRELDGSASDAYCKQAQAYRHETQQLPAAARSRCATEALAAASAPANTTADMMKAACDKAFVACLANPPKVPDLDCSSNEVVTSLARCGDLTIDEMKACTEEMRAKMLEVAKDNPCAVDFEVGNAMKTYNAFLAKLKGAACAVVTAKCKPPEHE